MANFFERFETSSQAERAEMARNLKALYNTFFAYENEINGCFSKGMVFKLELTALKKLVH